MAFDRYIVRMSNAAQGGNDAFIDFDLFGPYLLAEEVRVAQLVAYVVGASWAASDSAIVSVFKRASGSAGSLAIPFPAAEYAALATLNSELPNLVAYGSGFGTGALTPVGTSITVQEKTGTPGRSYSGRHYLPFTRSAAIGADGRLGGAQASATEKYYRYYILGESAPPLPAAPTVSLVPVVHSRKLNVDSVITSVIISRVLANLRTRRS